jgi:hypothetical protein
MKLLLYSFVALLLSVNAAYTQLQFSLPNLANPNLPNSFILQNSLYQNLQSQYVIKTTRNFDLRGKVKTVKETIEFTSGSQCQTRTAEYAFLENNKLLFYVEDSLSMFMNSGAISEQCTYDSSGNRLVQIVSTDGHLNRKTIQQFDTAGYLVRLDFQQFQRNDWTVKEYERGIFDYQLVYDWNKSRDTVHAIYTYKRPSETYQRFNNQTFTFSKEQELRRQEQIDKLKKLEQTEMESTENQLLIGYLTYKLPIYDSNGNILKYYIYDNTIKSSYNIHQLFEYEYNDKQALTKVTYSTSGPHPVFEPYQSYTITYLKYDAHGNWIEKKVTGMQHDNGMNATGSNYVYKRVIAYY